MNKLQQDIAAFVAWQRNPYGDPVVSDWTQRTGHVQAECSRGDCGGTCVCCTLSVCSICGCYEGSLLPYCPGRCVTLDEQDAFYKHYCDGTGPFAKPNSVNLALATALASEHYQSTLSPGAHSLYDALLTLFYDVVVSEGAS